LSAASACGPRFLIDTAMAPFHEELARLDTIHGVNKRTAEVLIAELGADMTVLGAFAARYRRIMPHRGHKKAVVAVAHAMLITAYHLLARQTTYQDPGSDYDDRRQAERARRRAIQTLERQGFRVALEPAA
jgi:transposase